MENTPAMSDHVVVPRELLIRLSSSAFVAANKADNSFTAFKHQDAATEAQKVLSAPSPEMVPMEEVDNLIAAIEHYRDECPSDPDLTHGFYAAGSALESTIHAFNAKFKP